MKAFHRITWQETLRIATCWPRRLTIIALLLNCSPEPEGGSKNANSWQIRILGSFFVNFLSCLLRSAVIILITNRSPLLNLAEGNLSAYIHLETYSTNLNPDFFWRTHPTLNTPANQKWETDYAVFSLRNHQNPNVHQCNVQAGDDIKGPVKPTSPVLFWCNDRQTITSETLFTKFDDTECPYIYKAQRSYLKKLHIFNCTYIVYKMILDFVDNDASMRDCNVFTCPTSSWSQPAFSERHSKPHSYARGLHRVPGGQENKQTVIQVDK